MPWKSFYFIMERFHPPQMLSNPLKISHSTWNDIAFALFIISKTFWKIEGNFDHEHQSSMKLKHTSIEKTCLHSFDFKLTSTFKRSINFHQNAKRLLKI